jgi:hypothetical protein
MANPDDAFQIIPLTRQDVLNGVLHKLSDLSLKNLDKMSKLHAKLGALVLAESHGAVIRNVCEVYFLNPFNSESVEEFEAKHGIKDAQTTYFFNDTALALCAEYGVALPASKGTITREELEVIPGGLGTMLRWDTFSTPLV